MTWHTLSRNFCWRVYKSLFSELVWSTISNLNVVTSTGSIHQAMTFVECKKMCIREADLPGRSGACKAFVYNVWSQECSLKPESPWELPYPCGEGRLCHYSPENDGRTAQLVEKTGFDLHFYCAKEASKGFVRSCFDQWKLFIINKPWNRKFYFNIYSILFFLRILVDICWYWSNFR